MAAEGESQGWIAGAAGGCLDGLLGAGLSAFQDIVLMDLFQHISNTEHEGKSVELVVCDSHAVVSHCTFPTEPDENFSGAQEESLSFRLGWRALCPPPECQSLVHVGGTLWSPSLARATIRYMELGCKEHLCTRIMERVGVKPDPSRLK